MTNYIKDWVDIVSKAIGAIGIAIAAINYQSQTKTKRAEWLKSLFEKFYEKQDFKEVRLWIENKEIDRKISLDDNVSLEEEKFTDYLNFFEFIATLEQNNQLKRSDILNLFDYYIKKLKNSKACMEWIENKGYGFEKLRNLIREIE